MQETLEEDGYRDPLYWSYKGLQETTESLIGDEPCEKRLIRLKEALKKYPHYYDLYIELADRMEIPGILELGCRYALQRLKDENGGKMPKKISWYFLENRHIHRIIYCYAEALIERDEHKEAKRLLNILLRVHPSDNVGARFLKEECLKKQRE